MQNVVLTPNFRIMLCIINVRFFFLFGFLASVTCSPVLSPSGSIDVVVNSSLQMTCSYGGLVSGDEYFQISWYIIWNGSNGPLGVVRNNCDILGSLNGEEYNVTCPDNNEQGVKINRMNSVFHEVGVKCELAFSAGNRTKSNELNIQVTEFYSGSTFAVPHLDPVGLQEVTVNSNKLLTCTINGSFVYISWVRDLSYTIVLAKPDCTLLQGPVSGYNVTCPDRNTQVLTILKVDLGLHLSTFQCEAVYGPGNAPKSEKCQLYVEDRNSFASLDSDICGTIGAPYRISANTVSNPLALTWKREDKYNSITVLITNCNPTPAVGYNLTRYTFSCDKIKNVYSLQILSMTNDDVKRTWSVEGFNADGSTIRVERLTILQCDAPTVTSFTLNNQQNSITVNENDTVTLRCTVNSNPVSVVFVKSFTHNGYAELARQTLNDITYTIQTTCYDAGTYRCYGQNNYTASQASSQNIQLFVLCSPRPRFPVEQNITYNKPLYTSVILNLTWFAYPEPPSDSLQWARLFDTNWVNISNDVNTQITTTGLVSSLFIRSLQQSDFGQYRLTVQYEGRSFHQLFCIELKGEAPLISSKETINTAAIVSGVVGGIAVFVLITVVLVVLYVKRRTYSEEKLLPHPLPIQTSILRDFNDGHSGNKTENTYYNSVQLQTRHEDNTGTDRTVYEGLGSVPQGEHVYGKLKDSGTAETSIEAVMYENEPKALHNTGTT